MSVFFSTIDALFAAAVYGAASLSFVRLLRYPRYWYSPSMPASFVTLILAALTVAHISFLPDGFDKAAMAISIGFFVVLFSIIAAPAIAFRPASRLVEFFARHGNHAGLWLLGPALFFRFLTSNIKLLAVLATAMAIELAWCILQRWVDLRRALYSLSENDLSVLDAQAKGDLAVFRHRHGIRELVLSGAPSNGGDAGKTRHPVHLIFTSIVSVSTTRLVAVST